MTRKPTDLIIANCAHEAASVESRMQRLATKMGISTEQFRTDSAQLAAHGILRQIAVEGTSEQVLVALKALGGPATIAEVRQLIDASADAMKRDMAPGISTPPGGRLPAGQSPGAQKTEAESPSQ